MAAARLSRRKRGAGGFEAWTLWGEMSATMVCDLTHIPPYGDLTGEGKRLSLQAVENRPSTEVAEHNLSYFRYFPFERAPPLDAGCFPRCNSGGLGFEVTQLRA